MSDQSEKTVREPVGSSELLACGYCSCELTPALSKAEPIGIDGPVKATCHGCGKFTARYESQSEAIRAWAAGKWAINAG